MRYARSWAYNKWDRAHTMSGRGGHFAKARAPHAHIVHLQVVRRVPVRIEKDDAACSSEVQPDAPSLERDCVGGCARFGALHECRYTALRRNTIRTQKHVRISEVEVGDGPLSHIVAHSSIVHPYNKLDVILSLEKGVDDEENCGAWATCVNQERRKWRQHKKKTKVGDLRRTFLENTSTFSSFRCASPRMACMTNEY